MVSKRIRPDYQDKASIAARACLPRGGAGRLLLQMAIRMDEYSIRERLVNQFAARHQIVSDHTTYIPGFDTAEAQRLARERQAEESLRIIEQLSRLGQLGDG